MKKISFAIFLLGLTAVLFPAYAQEKSFIESSLVINIEIPVHVYHEGKLVNDLTNNDFEVYENSIIQ